MNISLKNSPYEGDLFAFFPLLAYVCGVFFKRITIHYYGYIYYDG